MNLGIRTAMSRNANTIMLLNNDCYVDPETIQHLVGHEGTAPEELADRGEWLQPYCLMHGLRYCPRRQIEWFGLARRT